MANVLELLSDNYIDIKPVAEGGFGKVYRAKDNRNGKYVAVKVMRDEAMSVRESRYLKEADHPLFPGYVSNGKADDGFFIIMDYIWGENLADVLDRRKGFSQAEAMRLAFTIADGLAYLQGQDEAIIYRDLKAENLILTPDGDVRLVDFGCVCLAEEGNNSIAGTRGYAAPELLGGEGNVGKQSDVYCFGKLFQYLLTGDSPKAAGETKSILQYSLGLSHQLEVLIEECVKLDSNERIPDMMTVLSRMVEIATQNRFTYFVGEKKAKNKLKKMHKGAAVIYEKNVRA